MKQTWPIIQYFASSANSLFHKLFASCKRCRICIGDWVVEKNISNLFHQKLPKSTFDRTSTNGALVLLHMFRFISQFPQCKLIFVIPDKNHAISTPEIYIFSFNREWIKFNFYRMQANNMWSEQTSEVPKLTSCVFFCKNKNKHNLTHVWEKRLKKSQMPPIFHGHTR